MHWIDQRINENTLDIIKRARKIILKGWTQNTLSTWKTSKRTGKMYKCWCLTGALQKAAEDTVGINKSYDEIFATIKEGSLYLSIPEWNDAPGRKKKEVIEVLDKTIARLENKS